MSKDELIKTIRDSGCSLLNREVKESTTKAEIIDYLIDCKCKMIHKLFTGIPEKHSENQ